MRRRNCLNNGVCRARRIALLFSVALNGTGSGFAGGRLVIRQSVRCFYQGPAEEFCAEGTRFDDGDADAEWGQLRCEGLGKPLDGKLGGIVDAPSGQPRQSSNGGKIYDMAAALFSHNWQDSARDAKQAKDIGFIKASNFRLAGFF